MWAWLREYLELKAEFDDRRKICQSCETLKSQLATANHEKEQLLKRILEKPESTPISAEPMEVSKPKFVPWKVRQQLLEQEDRERARIMREAPKPISTEDLEKDLENARKERESQTSS